ncbi:MAG: hypothetical protein NVSMB12_00130 [Acidimicrobiales bacterium]
MNPVLPVESIEFGEAAQRAFARLGGVDAARRAEADPPERARAVARVLDELGADELDPREDLSVATAAAELCRMAGRVVLPYPVVAVLLRQPDGTPFAVVGCDRGRVDHADLFDAWTVARIDGTGHAARRAGKSLAARLGPFVGDLAVEPASSRSMPGDVLLALTLGAWQILGALERALELAIEHVSGRVQFGQPIAAFQAVQFQLADAALGVDGLRELSRFTLWRLLTAPEAGTPDVLALRVHALDTAKAVLRTTQQLHGASGVCDEYDISVICRHLQPALRLPFGAEHTVSLLVDAISTSGFSGLFAHGAHQ